MKLRLTVILMLVSIFSFGQGKYGDVGGHPGIRNNRGIFDTTLHFPTGCGTPVGVASLKDATGFNATKKSAIYFDSCGGSFYVFNPKTSVWDTVGAGLSQLFTSGLTKTGNTVKLGGTLAENTTINGNAKDLSITNVENLIFGAGTTNFTNLSGLGETQFDTRVTLNDTFTQIKNVLPISNHLYDVGSSSYRFKRGYFDTLDAVNIVGFDSAARAAVNTITPNYPTDNINFKATTFPANSTADGTLTSSLSETTAYFSRGLILKANREVIIDSNRLLYTGYGHAINENISQKLIFQVLDSATVLKIGIGIKSVQDITPYLNSINYLDVTLGSTGTAYNKTFGQSITSSGVVINKNDLIELDVTYHLDSVTFSYRNLTSNNSVKATRVVTTNNTYASVIGYPAIYFTKGHVRLMQFSISSNNFDYIVLGNSISAGYNASRFDSSYVNQLRTFTTAKINNASRAGSTTEDFLNASFNFKNKTVILSGIFGNDAVAGISGSQSKLNYQRIVDSLRGKANKIVHIDNPYRFNNLGTSTWNDLNALNRWLDTAYKGIDTIVHVNATLSYPADYADGSHPNQSGHNKLAAIVLASLPELFPLQRWQQMEDQRLSKHNVHTNAGMIIKGVGNANLLYISGNDASHWVANTQASDSSYGIASANPELTEFTGHFKVYRNGTTGIGNMAPDRSKRLDVLGNSIFRGNAIVTDSLGIGITPTQPFDLAGDAYMRGNIFINGDRGLLWAANGNHQAKFNGAGDFVINPVSGAAAVGTANPHASSVLDLSSTAKGFLPPRMTGAQAEAIASKAEGLMIYATTGNGDVIISKGWWGWNGTQWEKLNN